ncbi:prepilin-type N-terminal cleavage/methylation domain-containing protein [Nocardioides jiangxiensis]|uniref:Prepilin-type N-terminal cleavage/methylation domain-containing protein n=1 Tax=Nocardioides jiangxiensis TaxID=3064524 RepID=A0ABT9AXX3_9ACTN|nr:prepilin-type N-terminal cleavage/methylation domain-containing protein [Nocardioides sp. WY-20]MDO7867411.1 prepilin-type N-terminal cleavage/methylation domain-containing protein [Nocardioides sp. WY-20]
MANSLSARRRGDDGFTLIELLIVIIILGILAAIVVFSVRGIADRGNTAACKTEVRTVETAAEAYYAKKGSYPTWAQLTATGADQFLHSAPSIVVSGDYDASTGQVTHSC